MTVSVAGDTIKPVGNVTIVNQENRSAECAQPLQIPLPGDGVNCLLFGLC